MSRRNIVIFTIILIIFIVCLAIVLPIDKGLIGGRGLVLGLDLKGGTHLVYRADLSQIDPASRGEAMNSAKAVIEKRVDVFGVAEPVIQIQGEDRMLVELPGISDVEKAKAVIGQTAILEFGELAGENEEAKWTTEDTRWKPAIGTINGEEKELTSAYFKENTQIVTDNFGQLLLTFEWNEEGSTLSGQITQRLLEQPLGIFFGDQLLSAPIVRAVITDRGQIEGLSLDEATELSKLLNAGRLPVPLTSIYEQTVSPVLGSDFVGLSLKAGIIGLVLVMVFMIAYYRVSGVLASLALIFYAVLNLAIFKLVPVTLSLAGIGGFVVSVGMAVDANVVIFERMKEEIRMGRTLGAAIEAGFNRAWTAIRDGNIATFISCAILYWLGSSIIASAPVQGFALTLFIGTAVSMFSAITASHTFLRLFVGSRLAQRTSLFRP
jgi:preprotein translocase subunit SecD